jgi:hypothetical protein
MSFKFWAWAMAMAWKSGFRAGKMFKEMPWNARN